MITTRRRDITGPEFSQAVSMIQLTKECYWLEYWLLSDAKLSPVPQFSLNLQHFRVPQSRITS